MVKISTILEELIKYWYYPLTILLLNICLVIFLFSLFGIGLSTFIISFLLVGLLTGFWYRSRVLPSNKDAIGILLAIRSESTVDREKFENDFVRVLKKGVSNKFKGLETRLYPLHQYHCEKIDQQTSKDYLFKTNCHICIYGSIKLRDEEDGKKYYLDLDCAVRHKRTSEEVQGKFLEELKELMPPSNLSLDVKNEVVNFLVISEWLRIYILYNLVIANVISDYYKTAQDLLDYLSSILLNTKLQHPVIQKIQNRIVYRQLDIYHLMLSIFYAKWRNTRDEKYF